MIQEHYEGNNIKLNCSEDRGEQTVNIPKGDWWPYVSGFRYVSILYYIERFLPFCRAWGRPCSRAAPSRRPSPSPSSRSGWGSRPWRRPPSTRPTPTPATAAAGHFVYFFQGGHFALFEVSASLSSDVNYGQFDLHTFFSFSSRSKCISYVLFTVILSFISWNKRMFKFF